MWPIMDVHDILGYLVGKGHLVVPLHERQKFWRVARENGEEWAAFGEPHFHPIGLYGDAATIQTKFGRESVLAMFVNLVLWKPKSTRLSRYLIFAIQEERMTSLTLHTFLQRIAWSSNHAFSGRYPECGPRGEMLCGAARQNAGALLTPSGDRFMVTEHRGHWSWHKKCWKFLKTQWNGQNICHQCTAQGLGNDWASLYWNLDSNNHTDFTTQSFLANRLPPRHVCHLILLGYFILQINLPQPSILAI